MKTVETKQEDELRPEYDLGNLPVRKVGPERRISAAQWYV